MSTETPTIDDADEQLPTNERVLSEVLGEVELMVIDLLLKYEDGLTIREIADALGTEPDRVQVAVPTLESKFSILKIKRSGSRTLWGVNENNRIARFLIRTHTACLREVDR